MAAMKCLSSNIACHSMQKIPLFSNSRKLMNSEIARTSIMQLHVNNSLQSIISIVLQELRKLDLEYTESNEELQEKTQRTLQKALDLMAAMKLIDTLQWLGISYHYEEEIDSCLGKLSQWDAGGDDPLCHSFTFPAASAKCQAS